MMNQEIISVRDVRYCYPTGTDPVLRGVNFSLRRGEFVGLVGATGAGKTTLCQTLNGLIPHYTLGEMQGEVWVNGKKTTDLTVADLSSMVGLVFQDADAQLVMSTVEEECLLGPMSQGLSRREARQRARQILERLEISHLAERSPQALSGGQKQRVAIAAVMVTEPEVLVLDEATSELDAMMVGKIFHLCERLNREFGTTILLVSHEVELLARYTDRLLVMDKGRIVLDAPTRQALQEHQILQQVGVRLPQVTRFAVATREVLAWPTLPLTEEEALPVARAALNGSRPQPAEVPPPRPEAGTEPPLIEVKNVRFAYREPVTVLHNINLTFRQGEFTAIIGNNGSGKSTLMKLILGLLKPSAGQVIIDGIDTRQAKVSDLARRIGFIFQNPNDQLFASSVAEEVAFGLKNLGLSEEEIRHRVEETLVRFQLTGVRDVFPRFLARGDKQKVCIASIVAMNPQILLLDEPTTGQDYRDSHQIMELARSLNEQGITILLVTHDLNNVARYARRVIAVNDGVIVADGPTTEIMSNRELLASCHLTPPQIVRLSLEMSEAGIPPIMTPEALAEKIRHRLSLHPTAREKH
ncbi:MAG: ABC transporter ATP-binding protein [Chloroflexi bacterium]|nr:MAG: ABC transporter ATP-binding protein [Chloroflexota bacterium]